MQKQKALTTENTGIFAKIACDTGPMPDSFPVCPVPPAVDSLSFIGVHSRPEDHLCQGIFDGGNTSRVPLKW